MAIPRTRYFVRINGIAASREMSGVRAQAAADQAMVARPDAAVEIVQINPVTGEEIGTVKLQRGAF